MTQDPTQNDTPDYDKALAVGDLRALLASLPAGPEYRPVDVLNSIVAGHELPEVEDGSSALGPTLRILSAPTLEDAIASNETEDLLALQGRNLTIRGVRWFPSDYKESLSRCFAVLDVVTEDDGEAHTLVSGSLQVMTVAWRAWSEQRFPFHCRIVRAEKATRDGYYPYNVLKATV